MKKSTSIHNLNADKGLSHLDKILYLFLNFLNNFFPYANMDRRIEIRAFNDKKVWQEWGSTYPDSSPSRKLSDLFWRTLPWGKIQEELGEIHVFDTGCGHGNYGARLMDASGGIISTYTGVDAKRRPNWEDLKRKHPNFNFIESQSSGISDLIPSKANLFVTQSAIEHFDEDLVFFRQIRDYAESKSEPTIQIHLVPARAVLWLYLLHGLRQYTPRTISKITSLFGEGTKLYLYGLGGASAKKTHFKYFTWPVLITHKHEVPTFDTKTYDKELRESVRRDMVRTSKNPLFWALIIHSNPRSEIW